MSLPGGKARARARTRARRGRGEKAGEVMTFGIFDGKATNTRFPRLFHTEIATETRQLVRGRALSKDAEKETTAVELMRS